MTATAVCHGNGESHCCHLDGRVCRFLEEHTVAGRRWACGLRRELGSWDRVHTDPRYVEHVQPVVRRIVGVDCGDWPRPGEVCHADGCGVTGADPTTTRGRVDRVRAVGRVRPVADPTQRGTFDAGRGV